MAAHSSNFVTYNLHGLNNGKSGLFDLCSNPETVLVAVQEHWLTPNNLKDLNSIHPDFVGFGISAMSDRLCSGIYHGRPFGGVGFLWSKTLSHRFSIGRRASSGRCLSLTMTLDSGQLVDIVTVYFPCFSSTAEYSAELNECLSFIEDVCTDGHDVILLGDMNFECSLSNAGFRQCESVLSVYGVHHCDDFLPDIQPTTYCNEHLNQFSFIDHMFMSDPLRQLISNAQIVESGANLSDHRPLVYTMQLLLTPSIAHNRQHKPALSYCWRWDKSDLNIYYDCTYSELCTVSLPDSLVACDCDSNICDNHSHCAMIDA